MILITSAAYTTPGLASEFGLLPPCMLPVQNQRLYEHQFRLIPKGERMVLTLPNDFTLPAHDAQRLKQAGVDVVWVPTGKSLGESIVYALNYIADYSEPLRILHGDTLLQEIPSGENVIAISQVEDDYNWSYYDEEKHWVHAGYFAFSDQSKLISSITEKGYRFMDGVKRYSERIPLEAIKAHGWLDFGIPNTYFRSKAKLTTQRVFNDLQISRHSVRKCSSDVKKMEGEASWFTSVPKALRHYCPSVWNQGIDENGKGYYELEYLYLSSLAELFTFGANPPFVWRSILDTCGAYLATELEFKPADVSKVAWSNIRLYGEKTASRLKKYCHEQHIDMDVTWIINGIPTPSLNQILEEVSQPLESPCEATVGVMHGDFCFSNVLYDFKSRSIKVLDPRGVDLDGNKSIYGDIRYDVAKLGHSIIGMYDYIIGGHYTLNEDGYKLELKFPVSEAIQAAQQYFMGMSIGQYSMGELKVYPIMIHLFLSMLPLHSDRPDRQRAMLANALRLYNEFKLQL